MKEKYKNYMLLEYGLDIIENFECANNDSYLVNSTLSRSDIEMKTDFYTISVYYPSDISWPSLGLKLMRVYHER